MINALTSFRFIPALALFLLHCRLFFGWGMPQMDNFPVFMTAFFVLSGFVLAYAHRADDFTQRKTIVDFYLKRFARIFPAYILAVLVYACILHDVRSAEGMPIFRHFSLAEIVRSVVDSAFLVQGFFFSTHYGFTYTSWSLSCEMFFYFLFPFLAILAGRSSKILWFGVALASLASFNALLIGTKDYMYPNPIWRLPDFMIGMGFYYLCQTRKFGNAAHALAVASLPLIILLGDMHYQYMGGQAIVGLLFGLWIACVYTTRLKIFTNPVAVYLGKISYSFYLWQFLVMIAGKAVLDEFPELGLTLSVGIMLLLNIGIASLSYYCVETKAKKLILKVA